MQRARAGRPQQTERELLAGLSPEVALEGARGWRARAERDAEALSGIGGDVVARLDPDYPDALAAIPDAPPVLLLRGARRSLDGPAVAIVGARAATRGARRSARDFGRVLAARGLTIVSGLARGIDAEAHRGALEAGGRTVAVLAGGIDRVYPPEHRALAEEIADRGAIIGEMPLGTPPRRELFPQRNRVIAGLSLGVLVVEARERSGSLITVRHALTQGREVFVVPGSVEGPFARGNHRLLRDGARAVATPADLLEDLVAFDAALEARLEAGGRAAPMDVDMERTSLTRAAHDTDPVARRVLAELRAGPLELEALVHATGIAAGSLAAVLLDLTLSDQIAEDRDGRFVLVGSVPPSVE